MEAAHAAGQATDARVASARAANWKALVEYASTGAGAEKLREQLAALDAQDPNAALLRGAIDDGALLAQSNRRAENEYRAGQGKGPLTTPLPLTLEQQAALDEAARQSAEAEAARSVDPLGLRAAQAAEQAAQTPVVAPPIAEPQAPAAGVPVNRPGLPTQPFRSGVRGLPVSRPQPVAAQAGTDTMERPVVDERAARAEAARVERERQRAETQRVREERAAETRRVREERQAQVAYQRTAQRETKKLQAEVAAEVKATEKWMAETGTKTYTAPANTWPGPERWAGGERPSRMENLEALRAGRERYGAAFNEAMHRYAGEYNASDVLAACRQLEAQGRDKMTGRVRPDGWYGDYTTVEDAAIQQSRRGQFNRVFPPEVVELRSRQYVSANLSGVLWRARENAPAQSVPQKVAARAKRWFLRRSLGRLLG